jgi:cytochrome b pre-mRNA-processing protein 3
MIFSLFRNSRCETAAEKLYRRVAAAARDPALYLRLGVPDTAEGRFECLALHLVLVLRRLRELPQPAPDLAQELVDAFFRHLDAALRELGVVDMAVPKRIKKLAQGFYDRAAAYDAALDEGELDALAESFGRTFIGSADAARALARYAQASDEALGRDSLDAFLGQGPSFVVAGRFAEEGAR